MKKCLLVLYLVFRGSNLILSTQDLDSACETWNKQKTDSVQFVPSSGHHYVIQCKLQDNAFFSGKWTFEIIGDAAYAK